MREGTLPWFSGASLLQLHHCGCPCFTLQDTIHYILWIGSVSVSIWCLLLAFSHSFFDPAFLTSKIEKIGRSWFTVIKNENIAGIQQMLYSSHYYYVTRNHTAKRHQCLLYQEGSRKLDSEETWKIHLPMTRPETGSSNYKKST